MLTEIRPYYLEVSSASFTESPNGIQESGQVKATIEKRWLTGSEKIRGSIGEATLETIDFFNLPNSARMELHIYREPITQIRHILTALHAVSSPRAISHFLSESSQTPTMPIRERVRSRILAFCLSEW
jgi:hypothetical protein